MTNKRDPDGTGCAATSGNLIPVLLNADDPRLGDTLALIQTAFSPMDGVVDPPSSVHRLTIERLGQHCTQDEVWIIGAAPLACMILTQKPDTLYLGKLAVATQARGQGLARRLVDHATNRARSLGFRTLTLETRIELTQNHATFLALGFEEAGRTRHPGYAKDTSITFTKSV